MIYHRAIYSLSMADNEDDINPVKTAPLKKLVKQKDPLEKNAGSDAIELLQAQMEQMSVLLWKRASKYADERDMKTVQAEDIQKAYDDLHDPHDLLIATAEQMKGMQRRLRDQAEESPIYEDYDDYD